MKRIKQVSDKQVKLNAELKIVKAQIKLDRGPLCQCCETRAHSDVAHIIPRENKKWYSEESNLLLLCRTCHVNLDHYKTYAFNRTNTALFSLICNYLLMHGFRKRSFKLRDLLVGQTLENESNQDPREFNNGNMVSKISTRQRGDYRRNVITQYVKWAQKKYKDNYVVMPNALSEAIHKELKEEVLGPQFGVASTEQLNTQTAREYIDSCFIYFGEVKNIDIFEFGKF